MVTDLIAAKVEQINQCISPIYDAELQDYLRHKPLNLRATLNKQEAYSGADYFITPTDYDDETHYFNTVIPMRPRAQSRARRRSCHRRRLRCGR
ncbi:hypothetical protein [Rhodoferax sp.]|uniref:hypothetical protein n=1 Tax=Rhodoferax sp. TaxID=50421 RepID=UPI0025F8ABE5|nr:hypothetical protein [Rhodoferax sp.]